MKSIIICLSILFSLVSCGEKGERGKAKFKLVVGNILNASPSSFTGGLLIMGRRADGGQSFVLSFTPGLELSLQKGPWEFATIGWTNAIGGQMMTGPQQCSHQYIELRDDVQTIAFNMSANNCVSVKTSGGDQFADPQFMTLINGTSTVGFKSLYVTDCLTIDTVTGTCAQANGSSTVQSFRVTIPPQVTGIAVSAPEGLSACVPMSSGYATSNLRIPFGGISGFIRTDLSMYSSAGDCTGASDFAMSYQHGLADAADGVSMMGPTGNPLFANSDFFYMGLWESSTTPPSGMVKGEVWEQATTNLSVTPNTVIGDYLYFDGASWHTINASQILFSNGEIYFQDSQSYLFVKHL